MTDTKKQSENDIVATAEDEPVMITDTELEDTDGGFSFASFTPTTTYIPGGDQFTSGGDQFVSADGIVSNTADFGSTVDQISSETFLRRRPGRFGNI